MKEDKKNRMLGDLVMSPTISVLDGRYRTRSSTTGTKGIMKKGKDEIDCAGDSTVSQRRPSKVIFDVDEISDKKHRMSLVLQEVSHLTLTESSDSEEEEKHNLDSPDNIIDNLDSSDISVLPVALMGALLAGMVAMDMTGVI